MSDIKKFEQISESELKEGVTSLPIRPNQTSQYGQPPLSGKQLQERFDRLANHIATKFNGLISILNSTEGLEYLSLPDGTTSVADLIAKITTGSDYALAATDPESREKKSLDTILTHLLEDIVALETFLEYTNDGKKISDIYAKSTALSAESSARVQAVKQEATERSAADSALGNRITAEESARKSADTELEGKIAEAKSGAIETASADAVSKIDTHNVSTTAHSDIREVVASLKSVIDEFFAEGADNDHNLDRLVEIVEIINSNKGSIDEILTDKADKSSVTAITETVSTLSSKVTGVEKSLADKIGKDNITSDLSGEATDKVLSQKAGRNLAVAISEIKENGTGSGGFSKDINALVLEVFGTDGSFALEYDIDVPETGKATVLGIGECTDTDIVIGSRALERIVTKIQDEAFSGNENITSIIIPDSVTSLGQYMCSECYNLHKVNIGSGVSTIASFAFANCEKLEIVYIDKNVTKFASSAFEGTNVKTVYYTGTASEWDEIDFTVGNDLNNATIIFNYSKEARNESHL